MKPPAVTSEADLFQEKPSDQSPAQHRSTCPLTACSGTPGTQALKDLMELAEEGMTLTQYTATGDKSGNTGIVKQRDVFFLLHSSHTVPCSLDKDDATNELPSSGFVPETNDNKTPRTASVRISFNFIFLLLYSHDWLNIKCSGVLYYVLCCVFQVYTSKLSSDLSSMVNNPQLSDVQLQVDSGDVFFTHSFMLYARCPLLANMVSASLH